MATLNAANALMFGSSNDSISLGPAGTNIDTITGLSVALPVTLVDAGWINEDGLALNLSDSVDRIRGHQNHGVVKTFVSDSTTTLDVTLLESKLQTLQTYFDATAEKVVDGKANIAKFTVPSARKVKQLVGVVDAFDTSNKDIQWRLVFPHLELGERDNLSLKVGEITAWHYQLEVIGNFYLYTNMPSLIPTV